MLSRLGRTLTLVLSCCIFLSSLYHSVEAQQSSVTTNGLLAFASNRDGDFDIYTMQTDGTDIQQLTFNDSLEAYPAWSPSGDVIAFDSDINGASDIYLIDSDGVNLTNITNSSNLSETMPSWSPDGTRIAFSGWAGDGASIYIIDVYNATAIEMIASEYAYNLFPTWSPDGTQLAFISTNNLLAGGDVSGTFELSIVTVSSGERVDIQEINIYANPDWSWTNGKIIFYDLGLYYTNLNIVEPDGTDRISINNETYPNSDLPYPRGDENPVWSPDGAFIAFDSTVFSDTDPNYGDRDIYVMNSDGTGVVNLTPNTISNDVQPSWQPVTAVYTPTSTFTPTPTSTPTNTPTFTPTSTPTFTFTPTSTSTPTPTPTFTPTFTATPTPTPTRTPTPTATPIPLPPADTNLLTNPSFASGLAPWNTVNFSAGGVVNGVLEVTQPTSVEYGVVWKSLNTILPANTPMSFSVALGNSSAVPKRVQVILRASDWATTYLATVLLASIVLCC